MIPIYKGRLLDSLGHKIERLFGIRDVHLVLGEHALQQRALASGSGADHHAFKHLLDLFLGAREVVIEDDGGEGDGTDGAACTGV